MTIDDIKTRLKSISELPALPTILAEINQLLSNPRTTAPELSRVIMRDPSLTAKILKIANSPFFGLPKRITSVNQSIIALGFNTVRSIVLCSSVIDSFTKAMSKGNMSPKQFWAFSAGVAAGGRVVARNAGAKKTDSAFVAGLLHGVGKIVLDQYFHAEFEQATVAMREQKICLWEAERSILGVTDAEVSGVLLEIWKLSPELIAAVSFAETPERAPEEFRAIAASILVANVLAQILHLGESGEIFLPKISTTAMELAGITTPQWRRLLELTADEARKASVFFDA